MWIWIGAGVGIIIVLAIIEETMTHILNKKILQEDKEKPE